MSESESISTIFESIPELTWVRDNTEIFLNADLSAGHKLSDGEWRILNIIAYVEHCKKTAHTIFIDEPFAKLDGNNARGLLRYFQNSETRLVLIQQNTPTDFPPEDVLYLRKNANYVGLLPGAASPLETELFFRATHSRVEDNPLFQTKIWESDPYQYVLMLADGAYDAQQVFNSAGKALGAPHSAHTVRIHPITRGIWQHIKRDIIDLAVKNIISPKDLSTIFGLYRDLGFLYSHYYWHDVDLMSRIFDRSSFHHIDPTANIRLYQTIIQTENGEQIHLSEFLDRLALNPQSIVTGMFSRHHSVNQIIDSILWERQYHPIKLT